MPVARLAVRGGERRSIALKAGDVVTVLDPEGLQAAQLFAPSDAPLSLSASAQRLADGSISLLPDLGPPGASATFRA